MINFARIINNVAVDVSSNPAEQFHPSIASDFVPVPGNVRPGWVLTGSEWAAPETAPAPETAAAVRVSPVQFKLLFTSLERVAIKAAREADPVIDDFFTIVDDPRLSHVDLSLQSTQDALSYLVAQDLLTTERRAQILQGSLQ